jgi:hypothetical protein
VPWSCSSYARAGRSNQPRNGGCRDHAVDRIDEPADVRIDSCIGDPEDLPVALQAVVPDRCRDRVVLLVDPIVVLLDPDGVVRRQLGRLPGLDPQHLLAVGQPGGLVREGAAYGAQDQDADAAALERSQHVDAGESRCEDAREVVGVGAGRQQRLQPVLARGVVGRGFETQRPQAAAQFPLYLEPRP